MEEVEEEETMRIQEESNQMDFESLEVNEHQGFGNSQATVDWGSLHVEPIAPPFETFRGKTIVAGDTPNIDTDWTPYFKTNTVFESLDKLKDWLKDIGRRHNMVVVVNKSDFKGRNPRILFDCERSGTYKPSKKAKIVEPDKKREVGTKKCGCPFSIKVIRHPRGDDYWIIEAVLCGRHNHPLSPYIEGHAYHERLTPAEKEYFKDLSKGGVKPKAALTILKERNPDNSSSLQTLYNLKKKINKEDKEDRTESQQLMMLANEAGYVMSDRHDFETDIVTDFFFAHPDSISLAKCFPYIFIMDCGFRTIAKGLNMCNKEGCKEVRTNCIMELDEDRELYLRMWGGDDAVSFVRKRIDQFFSPTKHNRHYWMLMPETRYLIANFYSVVLSYLSKSSIAPTHNTSFTFTPQHSIPSVSCYGKKPILPLICIMYVPVEGHFVCVKLKEHAPIGPPTTFSKRFAHPSAIGWENLMTVRNEAFLRLFKGKSYGFDDKTEVIELLLSDSDQED